MTANLPAGAGYSGTPLPKKLGFKDGQATLFIAVPESLAWLKDAAGFVRVEAAGSASEVLGNERAFTPPGARFDVIHLFTTSAAELAAAAPVLRDAIVPAGMIWVSWPKKAAKVPTDITEDVIRDIVLPIGLVDVKVCAVDAVWSGLKLVIPLALRSRRGG